MTTEEAKAAWKQEEQKQSAGSTTEGSWIENMELPCRVCTDKNDGVEVTKPVKSFTTAFRPTEIWTATIGNGQDLCCFRCRHTLQWKISDAVIPCDGCGALKSRNQFALEVQRLWEALSTDVLLCKVR